MTDDGLTQRERRAQRARSSKPKVQLPPGAGRKLVLPLIILLVIGGVAFAMSNWNDQFDKCPGHWHSTMKVFVEDQEVLFDQYNLENQRLPMSYHMHRGDSGKWHFEPPRSECIAFSTPSSAIDMKVGKDRLVLDDLHESRPWGGTYEANETHKLHILHKVGNGDWNTLSASKLNDRQLRDDERLLIAFGDYTDEELEAMQAQIPPPNPGR